MAEGTVSSFTELQAMTAAWRDHNFPQQNAWHQLAGCMEELGELAHAFLKQEQRIRTNENLGAKEVDAIGDLIIYLCGYCSYRGISLAECITTAWEEVKDRDWIKYPETGRPPVADGGGSHEVDIAHFPTEKLYGADRARGDERSME